MSTRYQDHMTAALAGRHVPAAAAHTILGSLGGALAVAGRVGGATGALLARAARAAFMSGTEVSLAVGAAVALGGAVLVIALLPSQVARDLPDPSVPGPAKQAPSNGPFSTRARSARVRRRSRTSAALSAAPEEGARPYPSRRWPQ